MRKTVLFLIIVIVIDNPLSILYTQTADGIRFYPLELGNSWNYTNDFFPHTEKIIDTTRINGLLYYGLAIWSGEFPEFWLRAENDIIYIYNSKDSLDYILFYFNADIDQSWQLPSEYGCSFGTEITLGSINDTITTPSGTFINCFHFRHFPECVDAGILDTWFAEGIGKVRFIADNIMGSIDYKLQDYTIITSINDQDQAFSTQSHQLYQNYPNPFNATTIIPYTLLHSNYVTIKLYDILGQEIQLLVNDFQNAGFHFITFDPGKIPSGTYFYNLKIENQNISTKKLLYLK